MVYIIFSLHSFYYGILRYFFYLNFRPVLIVLKLMFFLLQSPYNVIRYSLSGSESVLDFFLIDPRTGAISLKKSFSLDEDKRSSYSVSSISLFFKQNNMKNFNTRIQYSMVNYVLELFIPETYTS